MNSVLDFLKKNRWSRGLILSLVLVLVVLGIKACGLLARADSPSVNHLFRSRTTVENHPAIQIWPIGDDDIMLSRWPWSWEKFASIFEMLKLYDARLGLIMEDSFGELGAITVTPDEAKVKTELLTQALCSDDPAIRQASLSSICPPLNQALVGATSAYSGALLSQRLIISSDQKNKAALQVKRTSLKSAFFRDKKDAVDAARRFGRPWPGDPGDLLQAIDLIPLTPMLGGTVAGAGFQRIIPAEDGYIRKTPTVAWYDGTLFFSQPVVAAATFLKCPLSNLELVPGKYLRFKGVAGRDGRDLSIPIDAQGMMYVNWTGKEQLKHFENMPFDLIRHFLIRQMSRRLTGGTDFDTDLKSPSLKRFTDSFETQISGSGFVDQKEKGNIYFETLLVWFMNTAVKNALPLEETLATIMDVFKLGNTYEEFYKLKLGAVDVYESMRINQRIATLAAEKKTIPEYNALLSELSVIPGVFSQNHLLKIAEGITKADLLQYLDAGLLTIRKPDVPENQDHLLVIAGADLDEQTWIGMVSTKLKKTTEKVKDNKVMQLYKLLDNQRSIYEEGYRQTTYLAEHGRLKDIALLFFDQPVPITLLGNKQEVSLYNLHDKCVFIGLTATGLNALNPTPFAERDMMAGLTPAAFNTIVTGRFIQDARWLEALLVVSLVLLIVLITLYTPFYVSLPVLIGGSVGCYFLCLAVFDKAGLIVSFNAPILGLILGYIAANLYDYWEQMRERRRIRDMFAAMVSPEVLTMMEENPDKFNLQGEKVEASMFSSDVSGFTTISEGVTAQELARILNLYLTPMSNLVMAYGGYVEKYEGDAIKADFGMPVADPDHAWKACFSALLQQEELVVVQRMLQIKYGVKISARMGVNTGVVCAGNMGSENKMQYCAIGEAVAMAEEFEPSNKMWETWIATGPETMRLAGDRLHTRLLDRVIYKHETLPVYEVLGWKKEFFLKHWEGKPIPKLVIEGWQKIIPEKLLAYLEYYRGRTFPANPFLELILKSWEALVTNCLECIHETDRADVIEMRLRLAKLLAEMSDLGHEPDKAKLSPIDLAELARYEKELADAKEPWKLYIAGSLLQLRKLFFVLGQASDKIPRARQDDLSTAIDTLEKNCTCYQKRILFPTDSDKLGQGLRDHLKTILADAAAPSAEKATEHRRKAIEQETLIRNAMNAFSEKAKSLAADYHRLMADHCIPAAEKLSACALFAEGRALYLQREWDAAIAKFEAGLTLCPTDGPCQTFIKRCKKFKDKPPAADWNGDWEADW